MHLHSRERKYWARSEAILRLAKQFGHSGLDSIVPVEVLLLEDRQRVDAKWIYIPKYKFYITPFQYTVLIESRMYFYDVLTSPFE